MNVKIKLSDCVRPLLLGALFLGTAAQAEVRPLNRVVAIVDNDVVMQSQLDARLREVQQTIAQRGAAVPPPESVLSQQVLERLIIENIQLQIGERSGIRITDEELNQAIGTIAQRNGMSIEQFRAALGERRPVLHRCARSGAPRDDHQPRAPAPRGRAHPGDRSGGAELPRLGPGQDAALRGVPPRQHPHPGRRWRLPRRTSRPLTARRSELYQQLQQGADFAQLAIARSASETALEGGEMGWRKAGQLPPPFDAMLSALSVGQVTEPMRTPGGFIMIKLLEKRGGDSQVRDEVNVRHILIKPSEIRSEGETKRLVERLYQRIVAGEDFAELAKNFSEDPGSALNGGTLSWIDPNVLVPEFREVMNNTPAGELSKPFKSPFGWHVLEVMGRRATDSSEQYREQQAMTVLRNRKYDEELQSWLRQIRDEAYVETKL